MNLFEAKHHDWYFGVRPMFAFGMVCEYNMVTLVIGPFYVELEWW